MANYQQPGQENKFQPRANQPQTDKPSDKSVEKKAGDRSTERSADGKDTSMTGSGNACGTNSGKGSC